jgi:hypothetical protein
MAHLSSVFSHPSAGKLQVTLSGSFFQGVNRDVGFPTGAADLLVVALIGGNATPAISRANPMIYTEIDYPGGRVPWVVTTTTLALFPSGTAAYGFTKLKLVLKLEKR